MWAMWEEKINRAHKHSFPHGVERFDIVRGSTAAGLELAFGTSSQRRVSANLLAARADSGAIQGINFALH